MDINSINWKVYSFPYMFYLLNKNSIAFDGCLNLLSRSHAVPQCRCSFACMDGRIWMYTLCLAVWSSPRGHHRSSFHRLYLHVTITSIAQCLAGGCHQRAIPLAVTCRLLRGCMGNWSRWTATTRSTNTACVAHKNREDVAINAFWVAGFVVLFEPLQRWWLTLGSGTATQVATASKFDGSGASFCSSARVVSDWAWSTSSPPSSTWLVAPLCLPYVGWSCRNMKSSRFSKSHNKLSCFFWLDKFLFKPSIFPHCSITVWIIRTRVSERRTPQRISPSHQNGGKFKHDHFNLIPVHFLVTLGMTCRSLLSDESA